MNTINAINVNSNNPSFNARYLKISDSKHIPQEITDAIYKSDAIDRFLHPKKNLWQKFLDLFRVNNYLNVSYIVTKTSKYDPYEQLETLHLTYGPKNYERKFVNFVASQCGVKRPQGVIPQPGEHYRYKQPTKTASSEIARQIEEVKDLEKILK